MSTESGLASLPMYDLPEVRDATKRFWECIRFSCVEAGLRCFPDVLTHTNDVTGHWSSPALRFTQICSNDLHLLYRERLRPIGFPRYVAPGCVDGWYRSWIVVRESAEYQQVDELFGATVAINGRFSLSGCTGMNAVFAPLSRNGKFFGKVLITGSHAGSLSYVQSGKADVASIDCTVFALLEKHRPAAVAGIRIIGETPAAPSPPFATRAAESDGFVDDVRAAMNRALESTAGRALRPELLLEGVDPPTSDHWATIVGFLERAKQYDYWELHPYPPPG